MNVKYVSLETLAQTPLCSEQIEVVNQQWPKKSSYSGYVKNGRKSNGIVIVCSDIELKFTGSNFSFHARKDDVVMIPHGIKYNVSIINNSPKKVTDSYTVNFLLYDSSGTEIIPNIKPGIICKNANIQNEALYLSTLYHSIHPNSLKISSSFFNLLYQLTDNSEQTEKSYYPIRNSVNWLNNNYNKTVSVEEIAAISKMSSGHFQRLFKKWTNMTPIAYRNALRINNAKTMLTNTDFSVSLIAEAVGFDDPLYFSKIFKLNTGMSPKEYRQNNIL